MRRPGRGCRRGSPRTTRPAPSRPWGRPTATGSSAAVRPGAGGQPRAGRGRRGHGPEGRADARRVAHDQRGPLVGGELAAPAHQPVHGLGGGRGAPHEGHRQGDDHGHRRQHGVVALDVDQFVGEHALQLDQAERLARARWSPPGWPTSGRARGRVRSGTSLATTAMAGRSSPMVAQRPSTRLCSRGCSASVLGDAPREASTRAGAVDHTTAAPTERHHDQHQRRPRAAARRRRRRSAATTPTTAPGASAQQERLAPVGRRPPPPRPARRCGRPGRRRAPGRPPRVLPATA